MSRSKTLPRLGILLSGRGSNFDAIARSVASGELPARIVLVVSNRPDAAGLELARRHGLETLSIESRGRDRAEYDAEIVAALRGKKVDWVCLAGYMRLLSPVFVEAFPQRILNIHPSLLPAFPGLEAQRQALEYGVKYAGCTVHFVDNKLDGGPIVMQAAVPMRDNDDEVALSARILKKEHQLYSEALRRLLAGGWRIEGRRVLFPIAPGNSKRR